MHRSSLAFAPRTARRARGWVWLIGLCGLAGAAAQDLGRGERYYHFVDEHGVPHFSNVPIDARYRPIALDQRVSGPAPTPAFRPKGRLAQTQESGAEALPQTPDE